MSQRTHIAKGNDTVHTYGSTRAYAIACLRRCSPGMLSTRFCTFFCYYSYDSVVSTQSTQMSIQYKVLYWPNSLPYIRMT